MCVVTINQKAFNSVSVQKPWYCRFLLFAFIFFSRILRHDRIIITIPEPRLQPVCENAHVKFQGGVGPVDSCTLLCWGLNGPYIICSLQRPSCYTFEATLIHNEAGVGVGL